MSTNVMSTFGYESLDDVFTYADIVDCTLTGYDEVKLQVRLRRTGELFTVTGEDLDDVIQRTLDLIEPASQLIDDILIEYNLTLDDLRELVGPRREPSYPALNEVIADLANEPIRSGELAAAAAQPFVFDDGEDLYLVVMAPIERF